MPVIKHKDQRVAVLMDVQNMYHSAKNIFQARVNFKAVLTAAVAGRKLIRALAYVIKTESGEEQNFFDALTKIGIEIKSKDLQIFPGGMKKADWDVGIAIDALELSKRTDAVVLISGDGDFVPLVNYLKMNGAQVEVASFGQSTSSRLIQAADEFTDLGLEPEKFLNEVTAAKSHTPPLSSGSPTRQSRNSGKTRESNKTRSSDLIRG
ncbi:MAG: hypothetical protein COS76_00275 [Candidatus Portnoybacteria bacterium CG06_land_8_20_14_3_00_39_12]|uniref:NYN domain-containing protein n=1 Tax=Candidatus Portnoybacteria bacterium CG06_land_8_20_14_3_00_39_12 TaxID=1974809 RepID=A0A2M7AYB3_9BACT|nr:MAG: hypothetical protein COS76_00275 [Candidatus Portnoybacteria bacterium CG06_land_8_20_14_3_00_39_12]